MKIMSILLNLVWRCFPRLRTTPPPPYDPYVAKDLNWKVEQALRDSVK